MNNEPAELPPALPTYERPKERVPAVIPEGFRQPPKPHSIINKMISRSLKMKSPKMRLKVKAIKTKKKSKVV